MTTTSSCVIGENVSSLATIGSAVGIAAVSSILILVTALMVSKFINSRKLEAWVKDEANGLVVSGFILLFVYGFIIYLSSPLSSQHINELFLLISSTVTHQQPIQIDTSKCMYDNIYSVMVNQVKYLLRALDVVAWSLSNYEYMASVNGAYTFPSEASVIPSISYLFGGTSIEYPVYPSASIFQADLTSKFYIVLSGFISYTFNLFMYRFVLSESFIYLMAIATVLRILPFTKYFANTILAIGIAFLIIYPVALIFEIHFFPIPPSSDFHITDYVDNLNDGKAVLPRMFVTLDFEVTSDGSIVRSTAGGKSFVVNYPELVKYYSYAVIASVFMLPLNLLLIIATVKAILKLFGEYDSIIDMFILGMGGA